MAAHLVPGGENLSTNALIPWAREFSRLVNVLKMPAMSPLISVNVGLRTFKTCPRHPGFGTPYYIQDTPFPFQEKHKVTSWISFHCHPPVIDCCTLLALFYSAISPEKISCALKNLLHQTFGDPSPIDQVRPMQITMTTFTRNPGHLPHMLMNLLAKRMFCVITFSFHLDPEEAFLASEDSFLTHKFLCLEIFCQNYLIFISDRFQVCMKTPVHLYLEPASETTILAFFLPVTKVPF